MKVERKVRGIVAKPYLSTLCEQYLNVYIRNDKLGDTLSIYDGEKMFTIKLDDLGDILKVNRAYFIRCKERETEPKENEEMDLRSAMILSEGK